MDIASDWADSQLAIQVSACIIISPLAMRKHMIALLPFHITVVANY
jgi:hypothetical protein